MSGKDRERLRSYAAGVGSPQSPREYDLAKTVERCDIRRERLINALRNHAIALHDARMALTEVCESTLDLTASLTDLESLDPNHLYLTSGDYWPQGE